MDLQVRGPIAPSVETHQPLYERVPTRDEKGRLLSDFMVLIPGLRDRDRQEFSKTVAAIQGVLQCDGSVVFADLNVSLNLLWVSHQSIPGLTANLVCALQEKVPEALLVAAEHRGR